MEDKIVIGKVLKAQGIKGEIKVLPITNDISRFKNLSKIYIGDSSQYEVSNARIDTANAYIKLKGFEDRNAVEQFKDKYILVDRCDAVKLPKGSYFVIDLINCEVIVDNAVIGILTDVYDYTGGADTYVVKLTNGKNMMFPALKIVLENIDVENKKIYLNKDRLYEVAVYED